MQTPNAKNDLLKAIEEVRKKWKTVKRYFKGYTFTTDQVTPQFKLVKNNIEGGLLVTANKALRLNIVDLINKIEASIRQASEIYGSKTGQEGLNWATNIGMRQGVVVYPDDDNLLKLNGVFRAIKQDFINILATFFPEQTHTVVAPIQMRPNTDIPISVGISTISIQLSAAAAGGAAAGSGAVGQC